MYASEEAERESIYALDLGIVLSSIRDMIPVYASLDSGSCKCKYCLYLLATQGNLVRSVRYGRHAIITSSQSPPKPALVER